MIDTVEKAFERLGGMAGPMFALALRIGFVHPGPPVSKSRARWSKKSGRFYTPGSTKTAEESVAWHFKSELCGEKFAGNVAVLAVFIRPNRQRIDADNLMKLVLDAGTKAGAWDDDSQVTTQGSVVELDADNPRTIVVCCSSESSLTRGDDAKAKCVVCGKLFFPGGVRRREVAKWCSKECRKLLPKPCRECGVGFEPPNATNAINHPVFCPLIQTETMASMAPRGILTTLP